MSSGGKFVYIRCTDEGSLSIATTKTGVENLTKVWSPLGRVRPELSLIYPNYRKLEKRKGFLNHI